MDDRAKVTALLLGGYLLGRTKKLKLVLTVAGAVAGTTAVTNRGKLTDAIGDVAQSSPELKSLGEKVTGRLADSGKNAARAMAARGVDQISSRLQQSTERMKASLDDAAEDIDPSSEAEHEEETDAADDGAVPAAEDEDFPADADAEDDNDEPEESESSEEAEGSGADDDEAKEPAPAKTAAAKKPARKSSTPTRRRSTSSGASSSASNSSSGTTTKKRATPSKRTSTSAKKSSTTQKRQGGSDE